MSSPAPLPDAGPALAAPATARARAHVRAQAWARRRRATHLALKAAVLALGTLLVVAGVAMLVLPGPGWAAVILGLVVLATEFAWAERVLTPVRRLAAQGLTAVRHRLRRPR